MNLQTELIKEFAEVVHDASGNKQRLSDNIVYGTLSKDGAHNYVKIDGSDLLTPVIVAASADSGDRIGVIIKNHTAIASFNFSSPSVNTRTMDNLVSAVNGKFNRIDTTYITAEKANLTYATIENLNIQTQKVHEIEGDHATFKTTVTDEFAAKTAQIEKVTGDLADYKKVVTRELITAKGWMAEGAIGDAQISTLTANKIRAGTIDTSLVTVASKDGKLQISDNTIQIKDSDRVRVQMGKDESGDYTLAVWDAAGKLIWDALGATENTIQRKIIRDNVVADDANIQGYKLDINSVVRSLNGADETISSTIVQVGNKFLNVLLEEQNNEILAQGENLVAQAAQIKANQDSILLKVSTQKFESYQRNVDSHLSTLDSSITSMKGQIVLKVEQTDIDTTINKVQVGGRNLIRNSKTLVFDNYGFGSPNSTKYMDENGNTLTDENGNILIE